MQNLENTNQLIEKFEKSIINPKQIKNKKLFTGVDLGTAFIVLSVVDEEGNPVAGAYEFADVVRDGMVVDYIGAIDIVKKLKKKIEDSIGTELEYAAAAIPPGTEHVDSGVVKNVCEACGFEVIKILDEPTAANQIINMTDGAIVDIGGGTTGISILKNGKVVKTMDESSGGRHFSLVLAGAYKVSYEEAEMIKRDKKRHNEIFPVVSPVVDKIISIIERAIDGRDVDTIVLVGGTAILEGIEKYVEKKIGIRTLKPINPMFVTPLGIAISCIGTGE